MGGAAPTPSGKGGKKPLDASINLVPFIDLLSCCISFLLITAVWTQLARMDVTQKSKAPSGAVDETPPTVQLTLFIDKDGYTFTKSTGERQQLEKIVRSRRRLRNGLPECGVQVFRRRLKQRLWQRLLGTDAGPQADQDPSPLGLRALQAGLAEVL